MKPEIVAAIIAATATIASAIVGTIASRRKREKEEKKHVEVIVYANSGDLVSAFEARIRRARRVDDVTWGEEDEEEQWSGQDRTAYRHLYEKIAEVIKKPDVIWREATMFSRRYKRRFEQHKKFILDQDAVGYSLAYFDVPPPSMPPLVGFAVIDCGEKGAEIFLTGNKIRLRIRHPDIVDYFSRYFELIWKRATKVKRGATVKHELLRDLETRIAEHRESQVGTEIPGGSEAT